MKWFDRSFAFDQPAWMGANIIERLRGAPARLEERLAGLPKEVLTTRVGGGWSIQEQAGHLLDLEPLWYGRIDDILRGDEIMREADLSNQKTHEAGHNAVSLATILQAFRNDRDKYVRRVDQLKEVDLLKASLHPRLMQPMRVLDLLFFTAEHDDHHMAEITKLLKSVEG